MKKKIKFVFLGSVIGLGVLSIFTLRQVERAEALLTRADGLVAEDPDEARRLYQTAAESFFPLRYSSAYKDRLGTVQAASDEQTQAQPSLVIFLQDGAEQEGVDALVKQLRLASGLSKLDVLSKEEVYNKYQSQLSGSDVGTLFSYISVDDLFVTIEVYLQDESDVQKLIELAKSKAFVYQAYPVLN